MILNILFSAMMYPVMLILFFIFKYVGKNTKKYVFGVSLTKEQKEGEEVKGIVKAYDRDFLILFLATMWEPFLAFLTKYISVQLTIWMMWFLITLALMMVPYARANRKAWRLKGTVTEEQRSLEYVELKNVRTLSGKEFFYPLLLSFIPVVFLLVAAFVMDLSSYQKENYLSMGITLGEVALATVAFLVVAIWMDRGRTRVINGDSKVNENYGRAKKRLWKMLWLELSYLNAGCIVLTALATAFDFHHVWILCITVGMESVVSIVLLLRVFFQQRVIENAYEKQVEIVDDKDDDRHWILGMFYYNKKDKRTLVEKRYGIGTTTNMATKAGKALIIVAVVALAWIPIVCVYLMVEDFTPMQIIHENGQVICQHVKREYVINCDEILDVDLVEVLPKNRTKSHGTSTDYLEKGTFSSSEEGKIYEFLSLRHDEYVRIQTEESIYYVNAATAEETLEFYKELKEEME